MKKLIIILILISIQGFSAQVYQELKNENKIDSIDSSIDHNMITSTAETIGEGAFVVNSYEIVVFGVTYGFTDYIQLSFTAIYETPFLATMLKFKLIDSDFIKFSIQPGIFLSDERATFLSNLNLLMDINLGEFATITFSQSTYMTNNDKRKLTYTASAALNIKITDRFKIILEGIRSFNHKNEKLEFSDGYLINYGARFIIDDFSVTLGFLRPLSSSKEDNDLVKSFPIGIPFISGSIIHF